LEVWVGEWGEYDNSHSSHEVIDNVTLSDKYSGRLQKSWNMNKRQKVENLHELIA
jgi:hypothetical protein